MRINKLAATAMLGISVLGLSACATGFPAQVSRYQAMPAPQGQTFFVVPMNPADQGGLEFSRYGALVAQAMQAQGYQPAASPQTATMIVNVGYGVDEGTRYASVDPFYGRGGFGYGGLYGRSPWGGFYGRPYYSRYGYYGARSPFYYGWDDPYWYGSGIDTYTMYKSHLDIDIRRKADNVQLFDGHAQARSTRGDLGILVPNLVEAMFTGFPGRSGENVKITVPPPAKN